MEDSENIIRINEVNENGVSKPLAIGFIVASSTATLCGDDTVEQNSTAASKPALPPKPKLTGELLAEVPPLSLPPQSPVDSDQTTHVVTERINAVSSNWFQSFNHAVIMQKIEEYAADGESTRQEFVDGLLFMLIEEAIKRGGAAVARTAKLFPELIKAYSVSASDVQACLEKITPIIQKTAAATPNVCKYFGIIYGVLLTECESDFGLLFLAKILSALIQDDAENLHMLKIMSQVLGAVQVIKSDSYLVDMYQRQKVDLQYFWPAGHQSVENVNDFLENNSLDCLLEYQRK
ncbi:hypothetical protein BDR26DRAFT_921875 [Obelidium mucronatum]|nr:hypothetical protein BDR26DRAFT_921875 [Obelidium mucronatum]